MKTVTLVEIRDVKNGRKALKFTATIGGSSKYLQSWDGRERNTTLVLAGEKEATNSLLLLLSNPDVAASFTPEQLAELNANPSKLVGRSFPGTLVQIMSTAPKKGDGNFSPYIRVKGTSIGAATNDGKLIFVKNKVVIGQPDEADKDENLPVEWSLNPEVVTAAKGFMSESVFEATTARMQDAIDASTNTDEEAEKLDEAAAKAGK